MPTGPRHHRTRSAGPEAGSVDPGTTPPRTDSPTVIPVDAADRGPRLGAGTAATKDQDRQGGFRWTSWTSPPICSCSTSEVAETVRWHGSHVTVDEYQDTDAAQQRLLDSILGDGQDLCVVGDPRQAIYSWKGAEPSHQTRFCDSVSGTARVVRPDQELPLQRSDSRLGESPGPTTQQRRAAGRRLDRDGPVAQGHPTRQTSRRRQLGSPAPPARPWRPGLRLLEIARPVPLQRHPGPLRGKACARAGTSPPSSPTTHLLRTQRDPPLHPGSVPAGSSGRSTADAPGSS